MFKIAHVFISVESLGLTCGWRYWPRDAMRQYLERGLHVAKELSGGLKLYSLTLEQLDPITH